MSNIFRCFNEADYFCEINRYEYNKLLDFLIIGTNIHFIDNIKKCLINKI